MVILLAAALFVAGVAFERSRTEIISILIIGTLFFALRHREREKREAHRKAVRLRNLQGS